MTTNDRFEQRLSSWLDETSAHRMPDHLTEVLLHTAATRQRPWWSSPGRWLPNMDVPTPLRPASLRPVVLTVVLLAIFLTIAGVLLVGVGRVGPDLSPLAGNGRIYVADGTVVRSYDADGGDGRTLLELPVGASTLAASPDGRRLAVGIASTPSRLDIVDIGNGSSTTIRMPGTFQAGDQVAWSPDSERIVTPGFDGTREAVLMASIADGTASVVGDGVIPEELGIWWPQFSPDGDTIAFVGVDKDARTGTIHLIGTDGRGLRTLVTGNLGDGPGAALWSPDPDAHTIAYVTGPPLTVHLVDVETGVVTRVGEGLWPSFSPDGNRLAYWTGGTVVVDVADVLAGTADPVYVFETPAHTQVGRAPDPGHYTSCDNPEQLFGNDICQPVVWAPDGTSVYGPDINGGALIVAPADGSGSPTLIEVESRGTLPVTWQPMP